jgi:hypothetical protein
MLIDLVECSLERFLPDEIVAIDMSMRVDEHPDPRFPPLTEFHLRVMGIMRPVPKALGLTLRTTPICQRLCSEFRNAGLLRFS